LFFLCHSAFFLATLVCLNEEWAYTRFLSFHYIPDFLDPRKPAAPFSLRRWDKNDQNFVAQNSFFSRSMHLFFKKKKEKEKKRGKWDKKNRVPLISNE